VTGDEGIQLLLDINKDTPAFCAGVFSFYAVCLRWWNCELALSVHVRRMTFEVNSLVWSPCSKIDWWRFAVELRVALRGLVAKCLRIPGKI